MTATTSSNTKPDNYALSYRILTLKDLAANYLAPPENYHDAIAFLAQAYPMAAKNAFKEWQQKQLFETVKRIHHLAHTTKTYKEHDFAQHIEKTKDSTTILIGGLAETAKIDGLNHTLLIYALQQKGQTIFPVMFYGTGGTIISPNNVLLNTNRALEEQFHVPVQLYTSGKYTYSNVYNKRKKE